VLSAPVVIDGRRQALAKDIPPRGGKWNAKLGTEEDTVSSETDNPAVEEIELANHQPDSDVPRCRECGDKAEVTEHPDGEPEYCLPCWRVIRALRARRRSEVSVNETRITLPCLSVRPPWAQAIVAGVKDVENRSWKTRYRGPVLIHASQRFDPSARDLARCLEEAADPLDRAFHAVLGGPRFRAPLSASPTCARSCATATARGRRKTCSTGGLRIPAASPSPSLVLAGCGSGKPLSPLACCKRRGGNRD